MTARRTTSLAFLTGLVAGLACWAWWRGTDFAGDLSWPLRGAQLLAQGHDPYTVDLAPLPYGFYAPRLLYPLPALWLLMPLTVLPFDMAGPLFVGVGVGLLSWDLLRDKQAWRLAAMLTSAPLWSAIVYCQWSPLLIGVALLPALSPLLLCKPSIGAALWPWRWPPWWAWLLTAAVAGLSVALWPSWVVEWWRNTQTTGLHAIPLLVLPLGPLLLLGIIAWRRPEGRLLIVLALTPQRLLLYDQLALWLIPATLREALALSILSWLPRLLGATDTLVMLCLYLPALGLVVWQAQGKKEALYATRYQLSKQNRE